jgi:hypothetical protein
MKSKLILFLLFCFVVFLSAWIAVSHMAKKNLVKILSSMNDDNIEISYNDIEISGFPKEFVISVKQPVVKVVNSHQIKSIYFERIDVNLDLLMRKPYLDFGQEYLLRKHSADMVLKSERRIQALGENIVTFELDDSLLRLGLKGDFVRNFRSLSFCNSDFEIFEKDVLLSKLENFRFNISKISEQDDDATFNLVFSSNYQDMIHDNTTHMDCDWNLTRYFSSTNGVSGYLKEISTNKFRIKTSGAVLDITGSLSLSKQKHAVGTLNINLVNYPELVSIFTNDGIRSTPFFNQILVDASKSELGSNLSNDNIDLTKNAKFSIKFTEDNIYFGNIAMNQLIMDALKNE